jgi:hypothetical protein
MFWRGVPADVQVAKQLLELVRLINIVVVGQHGKKQALTELAGAGEKQVVVVFLLQQLDEPGFIHVRVASGSYFFKI